MIYIIVILAILTVLFLVYKNKIKQFITKKVQDKKKQETIDYVYTPVGLTRTFVIKFSLEELGDGKAKIYIEKGL